MPKVAALPLKIYSQELMRLLNLRNFLKEASPLNKTSFSQMECFKEEKREILY